MRRTSIDKSLHTERKHSNKRTKKSSKSNKFKIFLRFIFSLGTICCFVGIFLLYGPYSGFRDWLITTAMTTMTHQYLATWFYDDATIADCLNRNKIIESGAFSNGEGIQIVDYSGKNIEYANEYEKAILQKSSNNNDYKIIKINGDKFSGYMAVIYDPSRIKTVATSNMGKSGEYLTSMASKHNAFVAINAGGFADENGNGTGSTPIGTTISKGNILTSDAYGGPGGLIGFNNENKLVLAKYSANQAKSAGIRDGVTFGPFLIVEGEPLEVIGNGGAGRAPRSAIAQRKDGIVLFLVLDGNRNLGQGAEYGDVIEILQKYGAWNAANLDGGTSTCMSVHNSLINDPTALAGDSRTRQVATAFILESDGSDNGDYSIVANKVNK